MTSAILYQFMNNLYEGKSDNLGQGRILPT